MAALAGHVRNWRAYKRHGAALADADAQAEACADAIEARMRTGRPLASDDWIREQERISGRTMRKRTPGPSAKTGN